jgi:uracil-DNA glycosylase family 4
VAVTEPGGTAAARREQLVELYHELKDCRQCPLADGRTTVVFGTGNANADLMFVGEAPGFHEDQQGLPFVGRAGKLLDQLLEEIGLGRGDCFIANTLKCLRYNAMVQLGDGSWERIGRLVRSRYSGEVMSVDAQGHLVPRPVVGWHASPLADRSVFRLTYRSAKNAGAGRVGIQLTGDHPVLTDRGFVQVAELKPGDRIATGQALTSVARDVLYGTLLGDGYLNRDSAHLFVAHSARQREYALFKANVLAELEPRVQELAVSAVAGGTRDHGVVHVRTLAHRALGIVRREFYRPSKVVPGHLSDTLNPRMLAIWFMDDGYMRIRAGRQPIAEIASVGFSDSDRDTLLRGLRRLGLPATTSRGRLYFNTSTTRLLSERIAPYVPPCMRYKLNPDVERRIPFDPTAFEPGAPEVLFDDVEVEDITDRLRRDVTFFCIDVEQTHNFVTAGGVVHNCRPPDNRDPMPAEIDACRGHLDRQIALIEPRVVCTLGNFATKLLTGSPQGITRVRGVPQARELGGRSVFLYPLFHPAAALRTTAVLEQLRADFQGLPRLLAEAVPSFGAAGDEPEAEEELVAVGADQLDLFQAH